MTKTQLSEGDCFMAGGIEVAIVSITRFGKTPHYGFFWEDENGTVQQGWVPCEFVDNNRALQA